MKMQFVQNLHKLPMMARPININSIRYRQLLLWGTESIPAERHNSDSGRRRFWIHLQNKDMYLIKTG